MSTTIEIKVPDIGDFTDVAVIDVLVNAGDTVAVDDALITLESDKAAMDVPASHGGIVKTMQLSVGDTASEGTVICLLEIADVDHTATVAAAPPPPPSSDAAATPSAGHTGDADVQCQMLVLGAGPGGYTAAFRAADLGLQTVLIERWDTLGGVCLNVGCIPSKALLHAAKVIDDAADMAAHGVRFTAPTVDLDGLRQWKDQVVAKLTGGLKALAKQRKVQVIRGVGAFLDAHHLAVTATDGARTVVRFEQAIIAAGSEAVRLPFIPDDPRVIDSTGALALADVPERLLVIGGGIIGLEMATVYHALGSKISVVEQLPTIMAGADKDIVKPYLSRIKKRYEHIWTGTKVTAVTATPQGMQVHFEGPRAPAEPQLFDRILVAVGRSPNGRSIDAHTAGVQVDEHGFVVVTDTQMRTHQPHIFAIGDIIGQPMLAHKAVHEGKVAAEAACGKQSHFDARVIPSVAYTDPEVAWAGVTEEHAKAQGIPYGKGVFPWAASGRALSLGRETGLTKLIFDPDTGRLIGAGIVGVNAGELIAEAAHAIEMGSTAADIGLTIHAHPTLSETLGLAAELFEGTITDLIAPKSR